MSKMIEIRGLIGPLKKLAKVPQAKLGGVACFIIKHEAIVSSGINYNPTGGPMEELVDGKLVTRPEVVHAEVAAIKAAADNGIDLAGTTLFVTMSPCIKCAGEIAKTPIAEVKYLYEWWDKAGLEILHGSGIKTQKVEEEQ